MSALPRVPLLLSYRLLAPQKLQLYFTANKTAVFHTAHLRDHAQGASFHPVTKQRLFDLTLAGGPATTIKKVGIESDNRVLAIEWGDAVVTKHNSVFLASPLTQNNVLTRDFRYGVKEPVLWNSLTKIHYGDDGLNQIPVVLARELLEEDLPRHRRRVLNALMLYGVVLIRGMPTTIEGTEDLIRKTVGPPRNTAIYGGMWDTAPRRGGGEGRGEILNDTAYTQDALNPHTDCTYLYDTPGLQCFNCVAQSDPGSPEQGATKLVDGFQVAAVMMRENDEAYRYFRETPLVFRHHEPGHLVRNVARVIEVDDVSQRIKQFRFNEYDLAPLDYLQGDFAAVDAYYRHLAYLCGLIRREDLVSTYKLKVGEMLVLDNRRVLHGRTAFTGYRNLVGCYVGYDDWVSQARSEFAEDLIQDVYALPARGPES